MPLLSLLTVRTATRFEAHLSIGVQGWPGAVKYVTSPDAGLITKK
jgi:hypothetical protein